MSAVTWAGHADILCDIFLFISTSEITKLIYCWSYSGISGVAINYLPSVASHISLWAGCSRRCCDTAQCEPAVRQTLTPEAGVSIHSINVLSTHQ